MVFKNPYGYLIKHFKLIHLFLTGLYVYLAIKVSSILQYYNHFVEGTASKLDAMSYVNNFYLIAIILSIIICAIVYALMRYKKKPRLLYLLLIILYIAVFIMIRVSYQGLHVIYISVLETKTLRLYRDLLRILILFQYLSIAFVLVRGLGFDIKKFNFVQDLEDLHLDEKDEEEIELALGGTESIQRRIHRRIREIRYYYLENKVFILIVALCIIVVLLGSVYFHKEIIPKEYVEGEVFSTEEFRGQVLNTFVTNRDVNNHIIANTDTSFVVVRMVLGTNREVRSFNTSNLILKINQHSYSSNNRYASKFSDLGIGYTGAKISNQSTYLFIYNIDNADVSGDMYLIYSNDKTVRLSPVYLDVKSAEEKYQVGNKIDWSNSIFGSGYFMISDYQIQENFVYTYQYEIGGKMNDASLTIGNDDSAVIHLLLDYSFPFDISVNSFLLDFGRLKYKIGEEENSFDMVRDKTPGSYKEGVYLLVDKDVLKADSVWFEFSVRNYKYIYTLK